MRARLVVHPIEAGLDGETGEHAVFGSVAVGRGDVDAAALVVQRVGRVQALLVPALGDAQLDARPLVHDRDGQRVQLLLAALDGRKRAISRREV